MICCVCGKEIPRGKRYKSPDLVTKPFCSRACYNRYVENSRPYNAVKDYINEQWHGEVNWPFMMKQIDQMLENYDMTYSDLYLMMKYAVEYEDYAIDSDYGLLQLVKFIQPYREFREQLKRTEEQSKDMPIEDEIVYITPKKQKPRYIRGED